MIAALILVFSTVALLQFFVSYCRSLLAASGEVNLSEDVRELAGIRHRCVSPGDFRRLFALVSLCPRRGNDQFEMRAVRGYFRLLSLVRAVLRPFFPGAATWTEAERSACGYFAAVALDRRIALNRHLLAQQISNSF